jgi:hypothetical protein
MIYKNVANTVKPVLRGQLWDKENVAFLRRGLLKEVKLIRNFLWLRQEKCDLFKTGGLFKRLNSQENFYD